MDSVIATSPASADSSRCLQPWRNTVAAVPIGISDNHSAVYKVKAAAIRERYRSWRTSFPRAEDVL